MNPQIQTAAPQPGHRLLLNFVNGEKRLFDLTPYLGEDVFKTLGDQAEFAKAAVVAGSLEWPGGIDLSYDTVYLNSTPIERTAASPINAAKIFDALEELPADFMTDGRDDVPPQDRDPN